MPRGIWLADAARAIASLAPESDEEFDAIMGALGLQRRQTGGRVVDPTPPRPVTAQPPQPPADPVQHERQAVVEPGPLSYQDDSGPESDLPLLDPIGHENVTSTATDAPSLPRPTPRSATPPMPHRPLLPPRSAPAILRAALSRSIEAGEVDVEAVVEELARSRPVDTLPRKRLRTMRFGVDILIDRGDAMQPFARDQAELVARIRRLVGGGLTTVRYFADSPVRGCGTGPSYSWQPFRPPSPGTKVIVVSDLGIGGPALNPHRSSLQDWRRFTRELCQQGCEPVVLVPYPPHRWPATLTTLFPLICWDRSTTAMSAFTATAGL